MKLFTFALAMLLGLLGSNPLSAQEKDSKLIPSITVVGTGKVNVKPDIVLVQVGVVSDAKLASEALTKNNKEMKALLELLRGKGIEDRDVQTTQFSVGPKYEYGQDDGNQPIQQAPGFQGKAFPVPHQPRMVGYEVTNMVQLKIRKLDQLGELLDLLIRGGANRVQGISFSVDEPEKFLAKARLEAIQKAKSLADEFATAAGVKAGRPLLIQEQSMGMPWPVAVPMAMAGRDVDVPLAAGEQMLTAQVTVTYALVYPQAP